MYYATGSIMTMVLGIVFLIIIVGLLISCIKIVPQAQAMVIERLGAYKTTWGVGFHVKVPIIEKVARKVDLKEQVVDFAPQPVITKDNVTMQIDTVVFYQITDPKLFCYGVANPIMAIENLTATTLRNTHIRKFHAPILPRHKPCKSLPLHFLLAVPLLH